MINKFLIKPDQSLGKGITSFMLTKNYFDKHSIEFNDNSSVEDFVISTLGLPIVWMDQVHGAEIQIIGENTANLIEACDGLYTKKENIALAIKTADCLPLILCSREGKELAALHVGWRGLHGGIVENAIMNFKCATENLVAWLAPCISSINYEVGEEVYSLFKDFDSESVSSFKLSNNKDKWIFSLKQECTRRLQKFDIQVIANTFCTFKDEQLFYSYRKNSSSKRMVTLAWRQK
tara:strand:+ start:2711 stop:3415 length:705 start_codon:yes stop_codon:yes gene_type:complete